MNRKVLALAGVAMLSLAAPALAQNGAKPAPVAELVKAVDIPYQQFTLANGLRVIVSTDRKAPVVAVSVWYNVGSTFEPKGKSGFAHLYEHLMFNGSENAPGDFFAPLKSAGATDFNGTTSFDRTNYFETVPTGALDRTLFLESDRMGHLTGAITQGVLDEQRGVVQNEKRQDDNQPYGLAQYKQVEGLFGPDHPYGHTTIGSMADLDAASLQTVKDWFRDHYGPNNAVLVLAGDIDVATARPLVETYFGSIPRGPVSVAPPAPLVPAKPGVHEVIKDRVAQTLLTRSWVVPGINALEDKAALDVAAGVLGGLASSRLDDVLVRQEKLATSVETQNQSLAKLGWFEIDLTVAPGVDPAVAAKRMDALVAEFLRTGPTADEVARVATTAAAKRIAGLDSVGGFGGKAVALAQGALYSNDPGYYKKQLGALAAMTPAKVKAVANRWLARPSYALDVVPGPRDAYAEAVVPPPAKVAPAPEQPAKGNRGPLPAVGKVADLVFPAVTRARLANGVEVIYAQRATTPMTQLALSFDAGAAADVPGKLGTQRLASGMLDEGTDRLTATQIAEAKERLGASIATGATLDRTSVSLEVPSANLAPALDLLAGIARRPAFAPADVERVKGQLIAGIAQELTDPQALANRALPPLVYGTAYPYAKDRGGGDPAAVRTLTRADLVAWQQAWLRPEKLKIFVVSDRPLAEIRAALDTQFGDWRGTGVAGTKAFAGAPQPSAPKIVLVDRPDSPQSVVMGGMPTALIGTQDLFALGVANDALGTDFMSRVNMDLRETRHWSYGAFGYVQRNEQASPYVVVAPVQADKTGASLASLRDDVAQFLSTKPLTEDEARNSIDGGMLELIGSYETSEAVLAAMQRNDLYKRPDDFYSTITQRFRGLTRAQLDATAKAALDPKRFVWVVVGDAKTVRPQLDSLGLPVEVVPAAALGAPAN